MKKESLIKAGTEEAVNSNAVFASSEDVTIAPSLSAKESAENLSDEGAQPGPMKALGEDELDEVSGGIIPIGDLPFRPRCPKCGCAPCTCNTKRL